MPKRTRSHTIEEESIRRFEDALPDRWVYRQKSQDYGIDGEVEIFEADGESTGLVFNVQLRATDSEKRADKVRLEVDELSYYRSHDLPTAVVRYGSPKKSIYWQWASNIDSKVETTDEQKTVTYRYNREELWNDATAATIRRSLEVRRSIANFPSNKVIPLRVDMTAIPPAQHYNLDRAIARAIANSNGTLVRAADKQHDVEVFVRLEPAFLAVGIDTLTSVTFDLETPKSDDYLTSILYALVRIFQRQGLLHQAEAIALLIIQKNLAHSNEELAYDACQALTRNLPALVQLAVLNGFHKQGPMQVYIALVIAKTPQDEKSRRAAMESFFDASLAVTKEETPGEKAAVHYSIANFYRHQSELLLAVRHYNRARRHRPAYWQADYFLREFAGVLFLAGRSMWAQRIYREAVRLSPDDSDLPFLFGDALLLSGMVGEARACFLTTLEQCSTSQILQEAELKILLCDHLITTSGSETIPRQRAEANADLQVDRLDDAKHLLKLARETDTLHPVINFNLGVIRSQEDDSLSAFYHFLTCAFVQTNDVEAWVNAAICAANSEIETLLISILSTAINYMGAEAYDLFREHVEKQGMNSENIASLDKFAMKLLEENEQSDDSGFTIRILDDDGYQTMK